MSFSITTLFQIEYKNMHNFYVRKTVKALKVFISVSLNTFKNINLILSLQNKQICDI